MTRASLVVRACWGRLDFYRVVMRHLFYPCELMRWRANFVYDLVAQRAGWISFDKEAQRRGRKLTIIRRSKKLASPASPR